MQASDDAPGAGMGAPARVSVQALKVIEGEAKARDYLARLQTQHADPDELAVIVSMLYGAGLRGFCRVLAKAIGGAT
jgi:hypothetical protein